MVGHTAPEYTTALTSKVDVYSLGVVLLELVTGRVANKAVASGHLATSCKRLMENTGDFSDVFDVAIPDQARYLKEMVAMFRLGVLCTHEDPQKRPTMCKVLCCLRNRGR
ncbi:cysteine-rich receptor-like protein kinase 2 [Brachypodium distachyon]|uniref:cysteine-rich receptor-like protein kinase 2 n=1 Tax=Brachypodium distachyon TaxID=15368 RepID=UPI0001C738B7|nr:cysteine-rich receptor-like protein kinase 2 [Brachypodium distachyon]|eukprot:XP_010234398.1 cysteine-rich receptor-like protein kinase 2 [Brachypodium distachyon]